MNDGFSKSFFPIINNQVFNGEVGFELDKQQILECYNLAKRYDVTPIIANGILSSGYLDDQKAKGKLQGEILFAVSRYEQICHELEIIRQELNKAKIKFIPLKGAVIREFYDTPWFRTSCDIDVLVEKDDVKRAVKGLKQVGFKLKPKEPYVIKLSSASGVDLELHYSLNGDYSSKINDKLSQAFVNAKPKYDDKFEYAFNGEFFMFYFLAHMAKHFTKGCGVKPFIDLKLLNERFEFETDKLNQILSDCELLEFYNGAKDLSDVWFNGKTHNTLTMLMEEFILDGGVYGSIQNAVAVKSAGDKGKKKFIKGRVLLNYEQLVGLYPSLEGRKYLIPFYQVKRWFRVFRKGRMKKAVKEISAMQTVDKQKIDKTQSMLNELNLNK